MRTIPDVDDPLQPLENAIHTFLIPALTGRPPCSIMEGEPLALPVRLGGLGLPDPSTMPSGCFQSSERITAPLVTMIISSVASPTI